MKEGKKEERERYQNGGDNYLGTVRIKWETRGKQIYQWGFFGYRQQKLVLADLSRKGFLFLKVRVPYGTQRKAEEPDPRKDRAEPEKQLWDPASRTPEPSWQGFAIGWLSPHCALSVTSFRIEKHWLSQRGQRTLMKRPGTPPDWTGVVPQIKNGTVDKREGAYWTDKRNQCLLYRGSQNLIVRLELKLPLSNQLQKIWDHFSCAVW